MDAGLSESWSATYMSKNWRSRCKSTKEDSYSKKSFGPSFGYPETSIGT